MILKIPMPFVPRIKPLLWDVSDGKFFVGRCIACRSEYHLFGGFVVSILNIRHTRVIDAIPGPLENALGKCVVVEYAEDTAVEPGHGVVFLA